jgi:hypothetical protein
LIGVFKQKNPTNALFLLAYALVLKFSIFLHPFLPVLHREDNYLYRFILNVLYTLFQDTALLYSILSFCLLYAQALLFNRICNYHKLFPRPNFLPGMSFILVTSLLPDWNHFSAPLLVNFVMIWTWYRMISLYNNHSPVTAIFNIGLLAGVASLLYIPAMAFLVLLLFALLIMRPFRIQEWLVGFLGFTSPYYFLILVLYFTKQLNWRNVIPRITITLPAMPSSIWTSLGLVVLILHFIVGGYFVQNNLNKMLIQVRKSWSLLLIFLISAVLVILLNKADSYENWVVTIAPFSAFCAAAYYYPSGQFLPQFLHWLSFLYVMTLNYLL